MGGSGYDTLRLAGVRSDWSIVQRPNGQYHVSNGAATYEVMDIERIVFEGNWTAHALAGTNAQEDNSDAFVQGNAYYVNGNTATSGAQRIANHEVWVSSYTVQRENTEGDYTTTHPLLAGADFLFGHAGSDSISAGAGNDTLHGGAGSDFVNGEAGHDTLYGNAGSDTLQGGVGNDTIDGGSGDDAISGGDGNDHISGGTGGDYLYGGAGNDLIIGGSGSDSLSGGEGVDFVSFGDLEELVHVDLRTGIATSGADVDTLSGIENISGTEFNDTLIGDAGHNVIIGGTGADRLHGGDGNDTLEGGAGNDTFIFMSGYDQDLVTDFQDDQDTLQFNNLGLTDAADALSHASQLGANVVFDFGDGDTLTINGTTIAALSDDILIA